MQRSRLPGWTFRRPSTAASSFRRRRSPTPSGCSSSTSGIIDGTLTATDPKRGTWTLAGIDLDAEATSLLGPFKANGRFGGSGGHKFRLSTGALEGDRLRLKLALDGSGTRPSADLDGVLVLGRAAWAGGAPSLVKTKTSPVTASPAVKSAVAKAPGPSFAGSATLAGTVPLAGRQGRVPWSLKGQVTADRDRAAMAELELRAGADMQALVANGDGTAVFGPTPAVTAHLHGTQVNLDSLAVLPEGAPPPAAKGLESLTKWAGLATEARGLEGLPFRLDLDYGFDTASAGTLALLGISGHLGLDGDKPVQLRFAASGPENARLALDGTLEPGTAPKFSGRLDASVRDLPRFAERLAPSLPGLAASIKGAATARAVSFGGSVDLSNVGIAARDVTLSLDRTSLVGALSYTGAVGADRARFFADLSSDALDLDALPDLGGWASRSGDIDLQLALAARAVKVAPVGIGPVDAGRIVLRLDRTAGTVRLDEFSAELGSARVSATANLDPKTGHAQAHVEAPQLDAIADLLDHVLPGRPTALLKERAGALSPANLDIALDAASTGGGALLPTAVAVEGTANATRISANLKPDRPGDLDPATAVVSATITADAPEASILLQQFGLPITAVSGAGATFGPAVGAGRIDAKAHGSMAEGFDTSLAATLGDGALSFSGKARPGLGGGHLSLKGADFGRLLRGVGLMPIGATDIWPADAEAELSWHDSSLALRHLVGHFDGIAVRGDLNKDLVSPTSPQSAKPTLFGALQVERLPVSALFDLGLGESAPVTGPVRWSDKPFGPAMPRLPRAEISMKIGALPLRDHLEARKVSMILKADNGAITLADLTGTLAAGPGDKVEAEQGSVGGTFTLRRDGAVASMSGLVSCSNVALDIPGLAGRLGGTIDLAGSGTTPAGLVGSLAGAGSLTLSGGQIARLDPGAITRTAVAAEKNTSEIDADQVRAMLVGELDRGALPLGNISGQATLAAGVLRTGPLHVDRGPWTADTDLSLDLRTNGFASKTTLRARQPLPDWKGEIPQITVSLNGPVAAPIREADAAGFVNALQSRAIARDQERIDVMQQDIRERAYFNRRLKAIEADQKAARDKAQAEADAARAKAKAEADAARAKADAEARAQAEAARAKAQAESDALQAKAKADAAAAREKAKAAADARAISEIDRQISQESAKTFDLTNPKGLTVPGASTTPIPSPRPEFSPGVRVPTIAPGTRGSRAKRSGVKPGSTPSIIQERSPASPDPLSAGPY